MPKRPLKPTKQVSKAAERRQARILAELARIRGHERTQHFEDGGSLVEWRGGTRTVTTNRKKQRNKTACRGRFKSET